MFLNEDDDWWEGLRKYLYPRIHPILDSIGLYSVGHTDEVQYAGYVLEDEDTIEAELMTLGAERNPIACFKSASGDRASEGSWAIIGNEVADPFIEEDQQLHITFFDRRDGKGGREIYAHLEPDWRQDPLLHLFPHRYGAEYLEEKAADHTYRLIDQQTFLTIRK